MHGINRVYKALRVVEHRREVEKAAIVVRVCQKEPEAILRDLGPDAFLRELVRLRTKVELRKERKILQQALRDPPPRPPPAGSNESEKQVFDLEPCISAQHHSYVAHFESDYVHKHLEKSTQPEKRDSK